MDGFDTVLIPGFGAESARKLARLSRECGAYGEVLQCGAPVRDMPKAVIFGGVERGISPSRFVEFIPPLLSLGVPVLACGEGVTLLERTLYRTAPDVSGIAALDLERKAFISHEQPSREVLSEFLAECGLELSWSPERYMERCIDRLSGYITGRAVMRAEGSAASIATMLLMERALGERIEMVYIDNGLGRDDALRLRALLKGKSVFTVSDNQAATFSRLKGVFDLRTKQKRLLMEDAQVMSRHLASSGTQFFINSRICGDSRCIRLYDENRFPQVEMIEPLRSLMDYEVKLLADRIGAGAFLSRQPLPPEGYAAYIEGEVNEEALRLLRDADEIWADTLDSLPNDERPRSAHAEMPVAGRRSVIALYAKGGQDAALLKSAREAAAKMIILGVERVLIDVSEGAISDKEEDR